MPNERMTENLVRDRLRSLGFYDDAELVVEEQRSQIHAIATLLRTASKSGKERIGSPEFIVTGTSAPDFVIVIECKAEVAKHRSPALDQPVDFAVDGVLHYARNLSRAYNVIAIAVSGESLAEQTTDAFLIPKGNIEHEILKNRHGTPFTEIQTFAEMIEAASFDSEVERVRVDDLMSFSRELHDFMREHAKLTESEKPLLVSGTLIALQNVAFAKTYGDYSPAELRKEWSDVIAKEIKKADIPFSKSADMTAPYHSLSAHPELAKASLKWPRGPLFELIKNLHEKVWPFISVYHDFDIVGQFYGEFLKYTGGDKKSLGIVLTPRHITELFALLANVSPKSRVLDPAAGTGGFLISAMSLMMKKSTSEADRERIKKDLLVGVEQQPNMFALAASNMLLRGDGKANLYQGNCFDPDIKKKLKAHNCSVGMVNPPYAQKDEELHELAFVRLMLDSLVEGGKGFAIVPLACATTAHPLRDQILNSHTLDAVMSMPADLFTPVGTVTCIMAFTAHRPHEDSDQKTWLGYWKDDGFVKTKPLGRTDVRGTWPSVRDAWVRQFRDRDTSSPNGILVRLDATDEWCAEAHMETDYSSIAEQTFQRELRNLAAFRLLYGDDTIETIRVDSVRPDLPPTDDWPEFDIADLFHIVRGRPLNKRDLEPGTTGYIGASDRDNGLTAWVAKDADFPAGRVTVAYDGSVGAAFYQPDPFYVSEKVYVLEPKSDLSAAELVFVCVMIRAERFRFSYGRKWTSARMARTPIRLPGDLEGKPDWDLMRRYIKAMRFSEIATSKTPEATTESAGPTGDMVIV